MKDDPLKPQQGKREDLVKKRIKEILTKHKIWYWMPSAGVYGRGGASDFICCCHGVMIAIEAKADSTCTPTVLQKKFMQEVKDAGGLAMVVHRANLTELDTWLGELITMRSW